MTTFKRNVFAAARLTAIVLTSVMISSVSGNGSAWGKGVKPKSNCHKGGGTSFPSTGHVYEVDFGEFSASLNFQSDTEMTFTILEGESIGYSETVQITAIPIRPCVFMVYWIEVDGTTVVHVEDFAKGIVYTNITQPGGIFVNLLGT